MTKENRRKQAYQRRQAFFTDQSQGKLKDLERQRVAALFDLYEDKISLLEGACVAIYRAMGAEASTKLLIETLYQKGVSMALPSLREGTLIFQAYTPGDDLARSFFGPWEPLANTPVVHPTLYIVPLLAFDNYNHRLGYGKGHYDRYFAGRPQGLKVGWAYTCQRIEGLDPEPHDVPLDIIITG